ncbi:TPA: TIGR00730 family Rossman fold protein [Candidatus Falkowbacteria bacterium]|nr:TIGR00730 family Rossman fold protein [Candidatus Falkowbacteria bacterium]
MERKISLKHMSDITWRIFRIMSEFVEGFQFLSDFSKEVTIFGSARIKPGTHWYNEAEKLGGLLVKNGYSVITGGGPGIMEAANKGAYKINPEKSIGLNIQLPSEQRINPFVGRAKGFYYFFTRKVMLAASAQAYIYFPGGFGTLDEMSEIITLVQTKKMAKTPIVIVGRKYYEPFVAWIKTTMADEHKTINPKDLELFHLVDTAEEVMKYVKQSRERTIF